MEFHGPRIAEVLNLMPSAPRGNPALVKELVGAFWIVRIAFLQLFGPLDKRDEPSFERFSYLPVRCRISTTMKESTVNCLEVQRHLHGLAHPDVIKRRLIHVHSKSEIPSG